MNNSNQQDLRQSQKQGNNLSTQNMNRVEKDQRPEHKTKKESPEATDKIDEDLEKDEDMVSDQQDKKPRPAPVQQKDNEDWQTKNSGIPENASDNPNN